MSKMLLKHGAKFRLNECILIREEFGKEKIDSFLQLKIEEI